MARVPFLVGLYRLGAPSCAATMAGRHRVDQTDPYPLYL